MKHSSTPLLFFFLLIAASIQCNKHDTQFCNEQRTTALALYERGGTVVYSHKHKRYAIRIDTTIVGNIDTEIIGFPCSLSRKLSHSGERVVLIGELKNFNMQEEMKPDLGGQELYFLEIASIEAQP